jgi:hypothetical protein
VKLSAAQIRKSVDDHTVQWQKTQDMPQPIQELDADILIA